MENLFDKNLAYTNILDRIKKKNLTYEGFLLFKIIYFTNNRLYYYLCISLRFIHLLSISGNFAEKSLDNGNTKSFQQYVKLFSCYKIIESLKPSIQDYFSINLLIIILYIIKIIFDLFTIHKTVNYKYEKKAPMISKFKIFVEHFIFLFFPYIIEYLSFSFYIYLLPKKFIIQNDGYSNILLFIMIVLNIIFIILFNIENYLNLICCNKKYTSILINSSQDLSAKMLINNPTVIYNNSTFRNFILLIFQNFIIFFPIENYLKKNNFIFYKSFISGFILLVIIILALEQMNKFNYSNSINTFLNILVLLCFYSIIFDSIIYISGYRIKNLLNEIIYVLLKFFISYTTFFLFKFKRNINFKNDIINIFFKEKNIKNDGNFINCFYYLHQILIKIKEKNEIESTLLLIDIITSHMKKCSKIICNCKLFTDIITKENIEKINNEQLKRYISELLTKINFLFESIFIDNNFYKNFDLTILLAEHYCRLKDNPTISFSIINSLLIKRSNKFSKFHLIILYELCQRYINYLSNIIIHEEDNHLKDNSSEILYIKERKEKFKKYYKNLKMSYKIKQIIFNYIDIMIKLLKYKSIFEDSLTFKYDENNENIISAKIKFFEENIIDSIFDESKSNNKKTNKNVYKNKNNLYSIIYLLKKNQLYYQNLLDFIFRMDKKKEIPIFIIFKYFLFFDIFENRKIPDKVANKLYSLLSYNKINNNSITKKEYSFLIKRFYEENIKKDSKNYIIFEYKNDLRIKYFTESAAIKLGYRQNDLINEKIDVLMPKSFASSHQNAINHIIIGSQIRYKLENKGYLFDKSSSILYPSRFEITLIYNISNNLILIGEIVFIMENQYKFMLNNNFEVIANSQNFEKEYFLNQQIIHSYNINILEILNLKQEKIYELFGKEFKLIQKEKIIRQIKSEEYLIPQFYTPIGEKLRGMMNINSFNKAKNQVLSNLYKEDISNDSFSIDDQEKNKLITKDDFSNSFNDLLSNNEDIFFHKNLKMTLNKGKFIENLSKELIKIPENDLKVDNENEKNKESLILSSKKLISELLTKNELINHFILISIKLSFVYDKPFYFLAIDDQIKILLNRKTLYFEKYNNKLLSKTDLYINNKNNIPFNNNKGNKKSRNKLNSYKDNLNLLKNSKANMNIINYNEENKEKYNNLFEKVNEYRKLINRDKFIFIIKTILSFIIILILLVYILIIIYQKKLVKIQGKILITYYLSYNIRDIIQNIHSELLQIFLHYYGFIYNNIADEHLYQNEIETLIFLFKESYHNFTKSFIDYNLDINHNFDSLYKKFEFRKLRRYWEEIKYESTFISEMDFLIYEISKIDVINKNSIQMKSDMKNFPFFIERNETKEKPNTIFIKVLYYLCSNFNFNYIEMFLNLEDEIYSSFNNYTKLNVRMYTIIEIFGIIFYIIFYITITFYLYFSNMIIIKNVIFLFLDFNEKDYEKNKTNNVLISLKLMEFQYLMDDFDLNNFEKYSNNLDILNKRNYGNIVNEDIKSIFKININININNNYKGRESHKKLNSLESFGGSKSPTLRKNNFEKIINKKTKKNNFGLMIPSYYSKKKSNVNNSSYNYLVESCSNYFKDKLSKNFGNSNEDILFNSKNNNSINSTNQNIINSSNSSSIQNMNNKPLNSKEKEKEKKDIDNYQDILLDKSNKSIVLLIKIFFFTIGTLIIIIIIFNIYKLYSSLISNSNFYNYFEDFTTFSERYSMLIFYFNNFRTVIFFPEGERKQILEESLGLLDKFSSTIEEKFNNLLILNLDKYKEVKHLFYLVTDNRNNLTNYLKQEICEEKPGCEKYLDSESNIFDSGIDFALKSCLTQLSNIFRDYKDLNNKTNITEINDTLIHNPHFKFVNIGNSINNMFLYVKEKIFNSFAKDATMFNNSYYKTISLYNIISIIFSAFLFIFVIVYIFISISKFTDPIKNSTYRINLSFFYIKEYRLMYQK